MTRLALLLALLFASGAAVAQPRLIPAGSVDVLYRLSGAAADQIPGGAPDGVRLQWDGVTQRLRAEPIGRPVYVITDLARRVADFVFPAQNAFLEVPLRGGDPQALLAGSDVRFTRRGTSRVAGLDCTEWTAQSQKLDATGCVTADGIVLRADGSYDGHRSSFQALSVTRGPVAPDRLRPPEGFARLPLGSR